jgi:alkylhydroperoxidase family enzyme
VSIIDALKPLHQALYFIFWTLAHTLWDADRIGLTIALWLESFRHFLVENAGLLVELVADALASPAGLFLTLALLVYGLWRLLALLFPDMAWKPVELPKILLYAVLIGFFFSGPAVAMTLLEEARQQTAGGVQTAVTTSVAPSLTPPGYVSGEPGLTVYDIDGRPGVSGTDLAASLLGVSNISELGSPDLPAAFQQSYFTHGSPAGFTLSDENARTDALILAGRGVLILFLAPLAIFYAIGEALLWLLLAAVAVVLWLALPMALMLAPFRAAEGLFAVFARRYVSLWIETIISAVLMGILGGVLLEAAAQGFGLFLAVAVPAGFVVVWRALSAGKLALAAVDSVGGAEITGGMGAVGAARATVSGGAALVGGLLTGGLATAAVAAGGAMIAAGAAAGRGEAGDGQGGLTGAKAAAMGGFLMGKSRLARSALQTFQEMRLVSGLHQPDQPDHMDAAYVGSLLSSRGAGSTYLALGMMDGPLTAYRRLGFGSDSGRRSNGGNSWGADETGHNPADWDSGRSRTWSPTFGSVAGPAYARGQTTAAATPPIGRDANAPDAQPANPVEAVTPPLPPPLTLTGRPEGVSQWVSLLAAPPAGATREDLVYTAVQAGGRDVLPLAAAVGTHGPEAVQTAIAAIGRQTEQYRAQGRSDGDIAAMFRDGTAYAAVAAQLPPTTPLEPADLQAIAQVTLAPRALVGREHLVDALATAVAQPDADPVDTAAAALGATDGLGAYAGVSRLVVNHARQMGVTPDSLRQAGTQLGRGERENAYHSLRAAGQASDGGARRLLADLETLPATMELPQSVHMRQDSAGAAPPTFPPAAADQNAAGLLTDEAAPADTNHPEEL